MEALGGGSTGGNGDSGSGTGGSNEVVTFSPTVNWPTSGESWGSYELPFGIWTNTGITAPTWFKSKYDIRVWVENSVLSPHLLFTIPKDTKLALTARDSSGYSKFCTLDMGNMKSDISKESGVDVIFEFVGCTDTSGENIGTTDVGSYDTDAGGFAYSWSDYHDNYDYSVGQIWYVNYDDSDYLSPMTV